MKKYLYLRAFEVQKNREKEINSPLLFKNLLIKTFSINFLKYNLNYNILKKES
jgi:hypothetical protein